MWNVNLAEPKTNCWKVMFATWLASSSAEVDGGESLKPRDRSGPKLQQILYKNKKTSDF